MGWKIIRNSELTTRADSFSGKCPRFNKDAKVTIYSMGSIVCKTDLQKTYHKTGFECDLLKQTNETLFSSCMDDCPLVPQKYI